MTEEKRQFNNDIEAKISKEFSADLKAVFTPRGSVKPEIDRAVMDTAARRLLSRKRRHLLRWASSFAAAAAIALFVFVHNFSKDASGPALQQSPAMQQARLAAVAIPEDIDNNGKVNILDAFKLARHIKSADKLESKWDLTGDGYINRGDVDYVAYASVRLDKGTL